MDEKTGAWWAPGIIIFAKVSAYIAAPIIIALYAGRALDEKYDSGRKFFFGLIALAFISTLALIYRELWKLRK